jgi:hypothetical protein
MAQLHTRLALLRTRLRLVASFRGVCWLVAAFLLAACAACFLDWQLHLNGPSRAIILVGALAGLVILFYQLLIRPLRSPSDDLSLALRVEGLYPELRDSLASTVQFLEEGDEAPSHDSPVLRRQTIERTLSRVAELDFSPVVSVRGVGSAGLSLVVSSAVALALLLLFPSLAQTGLARLANPFGSAAWPRQTRVFLEAPGRVARGEPFEVRGSLEGKVPPFATIEFDGQSPARATAAIRPDSATGDHRFTFRKERVERDFRFRVLANDAESAWQDVIVLPPPILVPIDGRPSPQVRLDFPAYTDLKRQRLPDGLGTIEAVLGTRVTLQAAADRPLTHAAIEFQPEPGWLPTAATACGLAAQNMLGALTLHAAAAALWHPIPITIAPDRKTLRAEFIPRSSGTYAIHFVDEAGIANARLFDLRVFPDPAPAVNLERPSRARDYLTVLPDAAIGVRVTADDPIYALRSVALRVRAAKGEPAQDRLLYDHIRGGKAFAGLLSALGGLSVEPDGPRLRPKHLQVEFHLDLAQVRHGDGRALGEGDILTLQGWADDFDDVTMTKAPGQSHEIEIRIVGKGTLEALLQDTQSQLQQELLRLLKLQQEALGPVIAALEQWRNTGKLRERDLDQLYQSEQLQQQIRARVGSHGEGLRADVGKALETIDDNHLPPSGTKDRLEVVARELDRLIEKHLDQVEPQLTAARKENSLGKPADKAAREAKGSLGAARGHQEEIENTLASLLQLLEPFESANQLKGETKALLDDQNKALAQSKALDKDNTRGLDRTQLEPEAQANLDRAAAVQEKLAQRVSELLAKMERMGRAPMDKDAAMAQALREAASQGRQDDVNGQMKTAAQKTRENNLADAAGAQEKAARSLAQMVASLQEQREKELDRLKKKLQDAQDTLAGLEHRQDELRKKAKEASQIKDAERRAEELRRLAREQEALNKDAQDLLRELSRLKSDQAGDLVREASEGMEQARKQMSQGENPEDAQQEALARLQDARQRLKRDQRDAEDELARERLAKAADEIKRLRDRQAAVIAETARIQEEVHQKRLWDRGLSFSLTALADSQKDLGQETETLSQGKLASAPVFGRLLSRAAAEMREASDRLLGFRDKISDRPDDLTIDPQARRLQTEALRRQDQLIEALKPEPIAAGQGGSGQGQPGTAGKPGDGIAMVAQLKALRILQKDVADKTAEAGKLPADPAKQTEKQKQALRGLREAQQEIVRILEEMAHPPANEGGAQ